MTSISRQSLPQKRSRGLLRASCRLSSAASSTLVCPVSALLISFCDYLHLPVIASFIGEWRRTAEPYLNCKISRPLVGWMGRESGYRPENAGRIVLIHIG